MTWLSNSFIIYVDSCKVLKTQDDQQLFQRLDKVQGDDKWAKEACI